MEGFVAEQEERRDNDKVRAVLDRVLEERDYQRTRWMSDKDHSPRDWTVIMTVWLGKASSNTYPYHYADDPDAVKAFKKRVTQLAAICLAALEALE